MAQVRNRGFFEVAVYHPKKPVNVGTLWRTAYQTGASSIVTIGTRYPQQAADTVKSWLHVPHREYLEFEDFYQHLPVGARLIAIEEGGRTLKSFVHPEQAVYLLGAEDSGIPPEVVKRCHNHVSLTAVRHPSYNLAIAGAIVMYHRLSQFTNDS